MRGLKRFLAACGGGRGEGETGDTPDPGRGLRPLHPLKSAPMGDTPDPGKALAALSALLLISQLQGKETLVA